VQAAVKKTDAFVEHSNNFGKLHNCGSYVQTTAGSWRVEARVLSRRVDFRCGQRSAHSDSSSCPSEAKADVGHMRQMSKKRMWSKVTNRRTTSTIQVIT
jgi:hypothetical protein